MGVEMEGFDELRRRLEEMADRAEDLHGEHEVAFPELFPPDFMTRYTEHPDVDSMLAESPWPVETTEDFEQIPDDEWDRYVAEKTAFEGWDAMQEKALAEWTARKLGL